MTTQQEAWDEWWATADRWDREAALDADLTHACRIFNAGWNARGKTLADVLHEINEGLYAIHDVLTRLCPRGGPIEKSEHTPEQWQIKMAYHHIHTAEKLLAGRPDAS
jgi:hypothetical protein